MGMNGGLRVKNNRVSAEARRLFLKPLRFSEMKSQTKSALPEAGSHDVEKRGSHASRVPCEASRRTPRELRRHPNCHTSFNDQPEDLAGTARSARGTRALPNFTFRSRSGYFAILLIALLVSSDAFAAPRVPHNDDEVLTRLKTTLSRSESDELRRLRFSTSPSETTLSAAIPLSRELIQLARTEADPRYLYQVQTLLAPWWNQTEPPTDVLLLRATIRQSLHDFDGALEDLDKLLHLDPQNGQAWLTRSVILTVLGKYDAARESCLQSMRFADPLAATTVTAALGGATGKAESAYNLLSRSLVSESSTHEEFTSEELRVRAWASVTLGELAERRGIADLALQHYEEALRLAPKDPFALAAFADVLLSQNRPMEALNALADYEHIDSLLLRLAEANQQLSLKEPDRMGELARQVEMLGARFDAARLRGNALHQREEARFQLRLKHDPQRALEIALLNWTEQKEWADAQILIEAAEKVGARDIVESTRTFLFGKPTAPNIKTANASTP